MTFVSRLFAIAALAACFAAPAVAQSLFTPVVRVNDGVVTQWELAQRQRFLTLLGAPPEVVADARDTLINERIQLQAARSNGVSVSDRELRAGMEEFASRANLPAEEFVAALEQAGVAEETFEAFVRAGLAWRNTVQARFGPQATISDAEVERALTEATPEPGPRVLLSEIVIQASTPAALEEARAQAEDLSRITSFEAFAAAAEQVSTAPSAEDAGRLDWIEVADLPQGLARAVAALRPGQVTPPIPVPNGVALYQFRATDTGGAGSAAIPVEYAEYLIPGGRSPAALAEAARIAARVDVCTDLYGIAQRTAPDRLRVFEGALGRVPGDVAAELSRLDPGEVSTRLTRGDALVVLMLCRRGPEDVPVLATTAIRNRLRSEQLGARAAAYLAELRADAIIEPAG